MVVRLIVRALAGVLLFAGGAAAEVAPYDGTGSHYTGPDTPGGADYAAKELERLAMREQTLQKAAGRDPGAMVSLARMKEQGAVGGMVDMVRAYDLYQKAADKGHDYGRERMCLAYILGQGRPKDLNTAYGYCDKLPQSNAVRLFSDGYDYANGLRGPKDEDGAATLYLRSAENGGGEAMTALGDMALVQSKPETARKWFRQAAVHGSLTGMVRYAAMVEAGQGGDADPALALWLYINAARLGNTDAKAWLAAQPAPTPLPRSFVGADQIVETTSDDKGTRVKPLEISSEVLSIHYPTLALIKEVDASVSAHCYVRHDQRIDLCLVMQEHPPGYGFGPVIAALFNGNLSVPERDYCDQKTAGSVFVFNFKWKS